ncbi:MAG: helix-turn-helix transcriptional regulator [Oscillospiraceae bacterium]|nr:helix-turn-helix transcriptional regulator [Oscillospiraceae bacterium]
MIRILLSARLGERRWTQADLARKTGLRPSTINEMYHEICERVSLEHLDRICEALSGMKRAGAATSAFLWGNAPLSHGLSTDSHARKGRFYILFPKK